MEFDDFKSHVQKGVDFRPVLSNVVRRHIETEGPLSDNFREAAWQLFREVERKVSPVAPGIKFPQSGEEREAGGSADKYYETKIKDWEHPDPSKRGNQPVAVAFAFWFFRYCSKNSYFKEIAAGMWPHSSEPFKRFIYAKCGGDSDDDTDAIDRRFRADIEEVEREFKKLWKVEEPPFKLELPSRSSRIYHYTNCETEILGREEEREALRRFRDAGPGFRWLQIAGVAGQGKSRLALDFVLKTRRLPRWQAGFLSGDTGDLESPLAKFADCCTDWQPNAPHLIVIDYVLSRTQLLKKVMQVLAERREKLAHAVCLVIVERQAWCSDGHSVETSVSNKAFWYCQLTARGDGEDKVLEDARFKLHNVLFNKVIELKSLGSEHLLNLVEVAAQGSDVTDSYDQINVLEILQKLDSEGRPLFALFVGRALAADRLDVTSEVANLLDWVIATDRRTRWKVHFSEEPPETGDDPLALPGSSLPNPSMRLALLATMLRSVECSAFEQIEGWDKATSKVRRQALSVCDRPIPGNSPPRTIEGLEPDLLGSWFVIRSIEFGMDVAWLAETAWMLGPDQMATFLFRVCEDFNLHPATSDLVGYMPKSAASRSKYVDTSTALAVTFYRNPKAREHELASLWKSVAKKAASREKKLTFYGTLLRTLGFKKTGQHVHANVMLKSMLVDSSLAFVEEDPKLAVRAARLLLKSKIVKDQELGIRLVDHLIDQGNVTAIFLKGQFMLIKADDENEAFRLLEKAADLGDSEALNAIGVCYFFGKGCKKSDAVAARKFSAAAEKGDAYANLNLALCHLFGTGIPKHIPTALDLIERACAGDCPQAFFVRAVLSTTGQFIERDMRTAFKYGASYAHSVRYSIFAEGVRKKAVRLQLLIGLPIAYIGSFFVKELEHDFVFLPGVDSFFGGAKS